jgi:starch-binding outer membrane protein, SusD/RagB family
MKNNLIKTSLLGLCMVSAFSCTDLEEKTFSEAKQVDFFVNTASFESAIVPAYASLRPYIWNYWNLSEHTSDELQGPTRGGDWGDGGQWVRLNSHDLLPTEGLINDLWNDLFTGVSRANNAIETFNGAPDSVKEKKLFIAEAKALRAFYYYLLCDTFGNVPLVTIAQSDPKNPPAQAKRADVIAFVEKELKAVLPDLLKIEDAPSGRFNQGVVNAILAKLYLNSEAWGGGARYADAISASDAVINSGKYELSADYFSNFSIKNESSKETILAAAFSSSRDLGFPNMNLYMRTLHYNQVPASPWNGFTTIAEVYDGFEDGDTRRNVMWVGQQFSDLGWPAKATTGKPLNDRTGKPLSFTKNCGITGADESNGIRVPKYQPDVAAPGGQGENDFIILRYADIMLVKAEALVRSGKAADALPIVNKLRARAGLKDATKMDLDGIYAERGHEMFWEGVRRQDQIRFGKFTDGYTNKTAKSAAKVTLFPIPTNQIASNPKLAQNAGY